MAVVDGIVHAGRAGSLNPVDLDGGTDGLDSIGNAGNQSAAADGHNHRVDIVQLVHNFQGDGTLTGNHVFVIKGMDKGIALFLLQFQRLVIGVVVDAFHQADLCAIALGRLHLGDGCAVRQTDQGRNAAFGGRQRHALRMVAGGAGNDASGLFLFGKHCNLVAGTADFEGAGFLQVFRF